ERGGGGGHGQRVAGAGQGDARRDARGGDGAAQLAGVPVAGPVGEFALEVARDGQAERRGEATERHAAPEGPPATARLVPRGRPVIQSQEQRGAAVLAVG